ncbi:PREDICTED: histone-lysine N-methyltransferase, H3 lysine-9 specific SUVH7-like [Camelina sativa]|uniref:Histone-lysine N-methyltransferase, H3 lysine-9 specific SUVH7-like n=1 Tax=Camelina sativa TaxID=90675 RepID=A0ABM0X4I5_CAMSA|nr:PREDICTED: histone-lysine N-methyltransferase, H3 lysine-9 specific SUVH7-like [Camelina sativa]
MASRITPFDDSKEFHQDGPSTGLPPPLLIMPIQIIRPTSADFNEYSDDADTGPSVAPTKLESCQELKDGTYTTTTDLPAPLMITPLQIIRPSCAINDCSIDVAAGSSTAPEKRRPGRPKGSKNAGSSTAPSCGINDYSINPSCGINDYSIDVAAGSSTAPEKRRPGRPKGSKNKNPTPSTKKPKTEDPNSRKIPDIKNFDSGITEGENDNGNRALVESVLMRFDAVRRKFCQEKLGKGILTTADANCRTMKVRTNMTKRIGPVPGVHIGDIFYYWGEMCLVGLHTKTVAGIDYMTTAAEDGSKERLAISVVTSSRLYDNQTEDLQWLIYSGHGGKKSLPRDQKLNKGNEALETSRIKETDVRVIRGKADPCDNGKKIYIYDGLYRVSETSEVTAETGCMEYRFRMERKPDQPNSGYANWKLAEDLRTRGMSTLRQHGFVNQDMSLGKELLRVPLFNDVDEDDNAMPEDFVYITSQDYSSMVTNIHIDGQELELGCQNCQGQSCIDNLSCMCMQKNGGKSPYHNSILVCRKPMIYECGESCPCPNDCKNRLVQTGLKLHMEVFKTTNCGWGLRSWDPIRAGTFICEFAGVRKTKEEVEDGDNYLFDSSRVYEKFRWNYEPELVREDVSERVPEVYNLPTQVLISAKEKGNVARFMNHSCSPNVFWQPIEFENKVGRYVRIGLFAMKHIPPMTELTYDYGVSSTERIGEDGMLYRGSQICLCGSDKCRGSFA